MSILKFFMPAHEDAAGNRQRKLIVLLLAGTSIFDLGCLLVQLGLTFFFPRSFSGPGFLCPLLLLGVVLVIGIGNRFLPPALNGGLFLLLLFSVITIHYLSGTPLYLPGVLWFAVPIILAGFLLFPAAGLIAAGLGTLILLGADLVYRQPLAYPAMVGFFSLGFVGFLTARSGRGGEQRYMLIPRIAHDLRTPMSAILGISSYLVSAGTTNLREVQKEGLEMVYRNCKKQLLLINEVMELSRIEAGQQTLKMIDFSLPDLLAELEDGINCMAEDKKISLEFHRGEALPARINTDRVKLFQFLFSFLHHLIKLAEDRTIVFQALHEKEGLRFYIKWEGDNLPVKMLEPLARPRGFGAGLEGDGTPEISLGFFYCRKMIELLGGTVKLDLSRDSAAVILFSFPPADRGYYN